MLEFIVSLLLAPITVYALMVIALICEYNERHGWTVILTGVLMYIAYATFQLTLPHLAMVLGGYVPVGFMWSFWRWKRHCDSVVEKTEEKVKELNQVDYSFNTKILEGRIERCRSEAIGSITPSKQMDRLVYWVLGWPFSFIEMVLRDFVNLIERTIRAIATQTYQRITAKATARIDSVMPAVEQKEILMEQDKFI